MGVVFAGAEDGGRPHVDINAFGEAIIVWEERDGRDVRTYKSEY